MYKRQMLPFVIGGGILIALAFLFDDYEMNPANFGKNTPCLLYTSVPSSGHP